MKIFIKIIVVLGLTLLFESYAIAASRESCVIAGKKVAVADISLNTNFYPEKKYVFASASYTFYVDQRVVNFDLKKVDKYLTGRRKYYIMSAVLFKYIYSVFKTQPCGSSPNKCVKEITISLNGFFTFLNSNKGLKKKYLEACISLTMLTPKYKNMDAFLLQRAREATYGLYGASYLDASFLDNKTLMEKMNYSIRYKGVANDLVFESF